MKDLELKINSLATKIEDLRAKSNKSTRIATIVYIVLVVFVFGYTAIIMNMLKEKATADSISAIAKVKINDSLLTDGNRQWVLDYCKEQTPLIADGLVTLTHDQLIPSIKVKIKNQLDGQIDGIIARLEKDVYPELNKVLSEHVDELKKHSDLTDKKVASELAKLLAKDLDKEMGKFINDKLKSRMDILSKELDGISSKKYSELTAKEAAERRMIVNWVFLMEHHESPANVFGEVLQGVNATYSELLKNFDL